MIPPDVQIRLDHGRRRRTSSGLMRDGLDAEQADEGHEPHVERALAGKGDDGRCVAGMRPQPAA